jgi:heme A synthase
LRRHAYWITGIISGQLILGGMVIASGKGFWVTNFHVLTGLTILALSFALAVKSFAAATASKKEGAVDDAYSGAARGGGLKAT